MFHQPDTTSDMRRALLSAVCAAVYRGTPEQKQWLGEALEACPFERMSDDALVDLAYHVVDPALVTKVAEEKSADRYEVSHRYHCHWCRDERVICDDEGRWGRCANCNPAPEPVEAK